MLVESADEWDGTGDGKYQQVSTSKTVDESSHLGRLDSGHLQELFAKRFVDMVWRWCGDANVWMRQVVIEPVFARDTFWSSLLLRWKAEMEFCYSTWMAIRTVFPTALHWRE